MDNAVPMVTQPPQTLQIQPQLIAQPQVPTQQFVPVSVMEQNGRQMLVTVSRSFLANDSYPEKSSYQTESIALVLPSDKAYSV